VTIGRHGAPWTVETARAEALRILGEVVQGKDPAADKKRARHAETVALLCDLYYADAEAGRLLTRKGKGKRPSRPHRFQMFITRSTRKAFRLICR
jgi:hypothetical protein